MEVAQSAKSDDKYFITLALCYLTIMVASTSVAYKPVKIWIFTATGSSLLFAITFAISSVIAEVYGKVKSNQLTNRVISCGMLFSIIVTLIPLLPSPAEWHHQSAFDYVFGNTFRFAIIGTFASWLSYRINTYLITKWKFLTNGRYFPLRVVGANTIGEFFLVSIVSFGAFYGVFPFHVIVNMFIFAYVSKIVYALILAWPAALIAISLKKKAGIDVYE